MRRAVTRRAFLGATVGGAGLLALPLAAAAATTTTVYGLDPNAGRGSCVPASGCAACYACVLHAKNKVFASAEAADSGHAHAGCKCAVVPLRVVDSDTFQRLFNSGATSADRRSPGVDDLLAAASDPSGGVLPLTGSSIGTLATVGTAAVVAGAALGLVAWRAQAMESRSTASTAAR